MHLHLITLTAAFFNAVTAIPCSEIGWSTGRDSAGSAGLNPFDPQGRWEVVKANDCWARFQTYAIGQNPIDARVTKTDFEATGSQVRHTINNYFGSPGNIMLWLPLATKVFNTYANILPEQISRDHEPVSGPSSIIRELTTVSIILPSGAKKLEVVRPEGAEQGESNENLKRADAMGITGLKGTISSSDWAYTTAAELQSVMMSVFYHTVGHDTQPDGDLSNAWVTAEKADRNECVVIDFRDFIKFRL
ncbi:galactose-binding like [Fusarium beomiforme]|uniref:Galactose-binding like n=1 Tax=Fusarium beomiforme TaxID=44412 RepID=A0A9P5ANR9_9HYPO|nr:galactose-binding like [Fusarium beomiforme]